VIIGLTGRRDDGSSIGAGKDAVAEILVREYGFTRIGLADAVKRVAAQVYGFSRETLWGPSELRSVPDPRYPREHGPWTRGGRCACCGIEGTQDTTLTGDYFAPRSSPLCYLNARFALQIAGTQIGRVLYEGTWADIALRHARWVLMGATYSPDAGIGTGTCSDKPARGVVIPDVRWPAGNEGRAIKAAGSTGPVRGVLWRVDRPGSSGVGSTHASERQEGAEDDALFAAVLKNDRDLAHLSVAVGEALEATRRST
jgi:hypothetical protein